MAKKNKSNKSCETCGKCIPIGDGDHICSESNDMVVSDYTPTDAYFSCGGRKWKEN